MGASDELIDKHPEIAQALTDLMTAACKWSNRNKREAAEITSKWIGVPVEAIEKSTIIYTTNPSQNWMRGEAIFLDMLNSMDKLNGRLKGKAFEEIDTEIYDFRFVKMSLAKN